MDYITINGQNLPYPKQFTMKRAPNIVCQFRTMTGKDYADVNGWKWADTTITWDALYPEDLNRLINAVQGSSSFILSLYIERTYADVSLQLSHLSLSMADMNALL